MQIETQPLYFLYAGTQSQAVRTIAKKLTAYQSHVRAFARDYTGDPKNMMKAAARKWNKYKGKGSTRKKSPRTSSPKKTKTRRKPSMARKKTRKRSGFRMPGGLGPKGILMGALGLMVAPRIIPVASPGAHKLAAGLGLRALKVGGGGPLAAVGIMELVLQYGSGLLGGAVSGFGGGNGMAQRYDY